MTDIEVHSRKNTVNDIGIFVVKTNDFIFSSIKNFPMFWNIVESISLDLGQFITPS
jgi:hypothetical protein